MTDMEPLFLRELHSALNAQFTIVNGVEVVDHYGGVESEHDALRSSVAVLDLSCRGRVCLLGADRARYLHGLVTNDVKGLAAGRGCYAALVTAKGRMQADLNIYVLENELLLDFEPGLGAKVVQRLEQFIVADDVQVADVAPLYGLLSAQGPRAAAAVEALGLFPQLPKTPFDTVHAADPTLGELYVARQPRTAADGYDMFVPAAALSAVANKLIAAAKAIGGRAAGWAALEMARIEDGIPRFGADMDENTLPPEAGIAGRAVSYNKGCYIGQEVLNRIHTMGRVNRQLRRLRFPADMPAPPGHGTKILQDGREAGVVTSAARIGGAGPWSGLGYLRREVDASKAALTLENGGVVTVLSD